MTTRWGRWHNPTGIRRKQSWKMWSDTNWKTMGRIPTQW